MNEVKEKREAATEPAKRWRNKWFVPWQQIDRKTKRHFVGPGIDWDDETFSSKDLAETAAANDLTGCRAYPVEKIPIYLSAFPEHD